MECGQIKEDLFNRQLWVLSSYPDSIAWSNAGAVASITNDTVHVHTAKFEYMATYKVKWISLERKPVSSQPEGMQPDKHSTLTDWIRENSIKDGGTHICAATWSDDLRSSQDHSPLLILLLTDGTLLLLSVCDREVALINVSDNGEQVCNRAKEASYPVECYTNTNCSLNLHGMSVVLDCATTYKTYCTERHLDITKQRVRCSASFTLFATNINQKTCILLLASHDRVTIWRMHYIASTYNSESNYGPVNYDMRGQQVQLRMDFLSECTFPNMRGDSSITSLLVSSVPHENATVSATTNITKESINVLCGTNDGDVHSVRFDLSLSQSNSSSSAPLARVLTASAIFVRKLHVLGTPINTMHFVDEQSTVCFVSGACVQTVPLRILISPATEVPVLGTSTALVKKGSISGLVVLPRNDLSDRAHRSSVLVCSTYGELKVHQFTPTPEPATATAAGGSSAAGPPHCSSWTLYRDVPNKANGYSMFGVASDSTGLFTAYLYRTPAIHYNTREVQLNNCLRWPRSAISWKMSPFLEQDFSASVHQTATVLLRLVRDAVERAEKDTVSPQVSFAALPMVFLQSLECDGPRAFYRSKLTDLKSCEAVEGVNYYPKVPSTVDVKQEGSSAAGEDYDSGDDGEGGNGYGDDDSDSGDSVTASAAAAQQISSQNLLIARTSPSDLYAFGAAAASRSEKKKFPAATGDRRKRFRRRVSNMTAVYERVGQLARPNRQEAVQLAVETIFDAAVLVALSLQQGNISKAIYFYIDMFILENWRIKILVNI